MNNEPTTPNETTYSDFEYDHIEQVAIENAIFSDLEDHGLTEYDFIQWLSDNGVAFGQIFKNACVKDGVLHYDTDRIEEYCDKFITDVISAII